MRQIRFAISAAVVVLVSSATPYAAEPNPDTTAWSRAQDYQNMQAQLGITRLRPGPSGRAQPGESGAANYDEALANPFPVLPDPLVLVSGERVTTPDLWWQRRRPEIVEAFEREVIGRVPTATPRITWTIAHQTAADAMVGNRPVIGTQLIGHADNSAYPKIDVNIELTVVVPTRVKGPVPVLMMFAWRDPGLPTASGLPSNPQMPAAANGPKPSREQLIAAGWGYAAINAASIQADDGAGLTKGIIGLTNHGRPRRPEDWGALRAWAWGAARALDYLETDPRVDTGKVGIEGVSRYGKAALVTLAFEPRFAIALVGSSGEGGAKPHRRNFGEAVENLTGSGEYHWMAGNFLKYGAAEATFGGRNASDLPVDAHELIALCAPRPVFISYGIPEKGDALWLDQQGSFMAAVAAQPVYRLLGAKDLGVSDDYRNAKKPAVNVDLLDGQLAWRQHDGGHEDQSNMAHFIVWANRMLGYAP